MGQEKPEQWEMFLDDALDGLMDIRFHELSRKPAARTYLATVEGCMDVIMDAKIEIREKLKRRKK